MSKSKTKTSVSPLKNEDGVLILDDLEISEILKSYFVSVFTNENLSDNLPEVEQIFKGDLSSNLTDIVITSETICLPLNIIFRKLLDDGVVPKELKLANVSAIFKMNLRIMRVITDLSV